MSTLKRIEIKGYKSIKEMNLELGRLNVLIGANGAGKSNLLSFFSLMKAVSWNNVAAWVARAGGADTLLHLGAKTTQQIEGSTEFDTDSGLQSHRFWLAFSQGDKLSMQGESFVERPAGSPNDVVQHIAATTTTTTISSLTDSPNKEVRHTAAGGQFVRPWDGESAPDQEPARTIHTLMSGIRDFHFHDSSQTAPARLSGYIEDNRELRHDAGNLGAMLYLYHQIKPNVYQRIVRTVRKVMPQFDRFVLGPERLNSTNILLRWKQQGSDYVLGPHQISDGSLRAMALVTLLLQPESDLPDVIILDEPELGLHPHALEIVAGLIRAASTLKQVIVATQSETFINHFDIAEVIVVDVGQNGSQFRRLSEEDWKDWLAEYSLGELWRRNVIGGGPMP